MSAWTSQVPPGLVAETHCHSSIGCDHAYSSIDENAKEAAAQGLGWLAVTDHGPQMLDGPHPWFFGNMKRTLPPELYGVKLLCGAELNIMDYDGTLDLSEEFTKRLDWVIASYHTVCCAPKDTDAHSAGWIAVAKNPLVKVIGHCGDMRFAFDFEPVMKAFRDYGKIVEINAHSFDTRPGTWENCAVVAKWCKKLDIPVVVSSDAHFYTQIGRVQKALDLLDTVDFPREQILNLDEKRFASVL